MLPIYVIEGQRMDLAIYVACQARVFTLRTYGLTLMYVHSCGQNLSRGRVGSGPRIRNPLPTGQCPTYLLRIRGQVSVLAGTAILVRSSRLDTYLLRGIPPLVIYVVSQRHGDRKVFIVVLL